MFDRRQQLALESDAIAARGPSRHAVRAYDQNRGATLLPQYTARPVSSPPANLSSNQTGQNDLGHSVVVYVEASLDTLSGLGIRVQATIVKRRVS